MTNRQGKTQTGSHEYHLGGNYYATAMGSGAGWYIFEGKQGAGAQDTGVDFRTLRACRQWAQAYHEAMSADDREPAMSYEVGVRGWEY